MPDRQNEVLDGFGFDSGGYYVVPTPDGSAYERPSFVLESYKWSSPTRGTSGGTITWAVVSAGQSYSSDSEYTSQASAISSVFVPTLRAAFARWDAVGNFSFVETTNPSTAGIVLIFDELQAQSPNTIGLAYTYSTSAGSITNSYISFDLGRRYRLIDGTVQIVGSPTSQSTIDLYTLALHEIGHALGLGHEDDLPTVMNTTTDASVTDLTSDDIAAIRAVYGTSVTTPTVDEYPGSAATTATVAVGGSVTGRVDNTTDQDWFRVTLTAGTSYRIDLRGNDSGGGTLLDPYLRLLNSSGTELAADDNAGTGIDAQIVYTVSTSGTYYISASGTGGELGTYTLAVATTILDDYTATTATAGAVTAGGTATGNIETTGDRDWFRVTLTGGVTYRFDLRGSATSGGTLSDPYVVLRNSSGTQLAFDDDTGAGLDAQLSYAVTTSGTYYVEARSAVTSGTGTYTLAVTATSSSDDYGATTATAGSMNVGATLTGSIGQPADVDWIRVTLTAGTLYRFDGRGTATGGGTLADPILSLLNASGTAIITDNNSGEGADARILYTARTTGTYYLSMRSNSATATGSYSIAAAANPDDYTATTATTGAVAVGGTANGVVETAGDRDWFRVNLNAATTYTIEVRGTAAGSALRWTESSLVVRNSSGTAVASGTEQGLGAAARMTFTPSAAGTYFIDALAYSTGVGGYSVSVTTATAQQAPAIIDEASDLPVTGRRSTCGWRCACHFAVNLEAVAAAPTVDLNDYTPVAMASMAQPALSPFAELMAAPDLPDEDRHRFEAATRIDLLLTRENPFSLPPLG